MSQVLLNFNLSNYFSIHFSNKSTESYVSHATQKYRKYLKTLKTDWNICLRILSSRWENFFVIYDLLVQFLNVSCLCKMMWYFLIVTDELEIFQLENQRFSSPTIEIFHKFIGWDCFMYHMFLGDNEVTPGIRRHLHCQDFWSYFTIWISE